MKIKNIFKKNQIIIFALAIMICVAGYLNFASDSANDEEQQNKASETYNEDLFADQEGDKLVDSVSGEDLQADVDDPDNFLVVNDPVNTDIDLIATDPVSGEDDAAQTTDPVSETSTPGEAVLVTNTINSSYFMSTKLAREQQRAKSKANLMDIIDNDALAEESKADAIDAIIEMTAISEKENATEILLEAKGFSDAVVCIVDGMVDVIINSPTLTDQDMAIIEDVVMRKTGVSADKIFITPTVAEE